MGFDTWRQSLKKETGEWGPGRVTPKPRVGLPVDRRMFALAPLGETHACNPAHCAGRQAGDWMEGGQWAWSPVGRSDLQCVCLWGSRERASPGRWGQTSDCRLRAPLQESLLL